MDQMNPQSVQPKKHLKAFWPLVIIFVVASLLGGLVYWYQFNLVTDYELQSMVLTVHRRGEKTDGSTNKAPSTPVSAPKTK